MGHGFSRQITEKCGIKYRNGNYILGRGDHGPGRAVAKKNCPLTGPGLISGRIFVSNTR